MRLQEEERGRAKEKERDKERMLLHRLNDRLAGEEEQRRVLMSRCDDRQTILLPYAIYFYVTQHHSISFHFIYSIVFYPI